MGGVEPVGARMARRSSSSEEKEGSRRGMGWWVLLFRDAQRRASHSDGDAMVLEAVEEGIDQWFSLKESVPVAVLEI